jgi:uncharacterized integral membrane protein (TIGR00698 family)
VLATELRGERSGERAVRRVVALTPGLIAVCAVAAVATVGGRLLPVIGAPVIGVALGVAGSRLARRHVPMQAGVAFASRTVLQVAVVILGAQLSIRQVLEVGAGSLPVMLGTLTACLVLAYLVGRALGIGSDLRTLIGVGTGICGASAIAAVSPSIRARHPDIAYAISTIFVFNIAAVLAFPPLGRALHLSQHAFGLFAGTAVNDTSSVVAAASTYGAAAGNYAVVVKLTRTLMIIPICLVLAALTQQRDNRTCDVPARSPVGGVARLVPWFIVGFLALAALNSVGVIPATAHPGLQAVAVVLITIALTAIGMSTDVAALRRTGARPLLLGLVLWIAVTGTSLALQAI